MNSPERIDLINYSDEITTMLANSIAPARANFVKILSMSEKKALIIVPDDQLAIAIGKDWQNIKLASRLTGWELEVKSETQKAKEAEDAAAATQNTIANIEGIGPKTAEILQKAGYESAEQIATAEAEHLSALQGIGEKTAAKIIESAKQFIAAQEHADDQAN